MTEGNKEVRFEFLLTKQERTWLREIAAEKKVSCGEVLRAHVRALHKRRTRPRK